jgi:hypothetical protein
MPRPSYESINYSVRPAKSIERKMLVEAFRRCSAFASLSAYRYVGFGSAYFTDFSLVHRSLGIENLVSIEDAAQIKRPRFHFNRPYECVSVLFGRAGDVLPTLEWTERTITWLDYDRGLDTEKMSDIDTVCAAAPSGSVLAISVNVDTRELDAEGEGVQAPMAERRLSRLRENVGSDAVPLDVTAAQLRQWGLSDVSRRIISDTITKSLTVRNGGRRAGTRFRYEQLFHFRYSDNARMLTVGGVILEEGEAPRFASADFEALDFVRRGTEAYEIDVPKLTFREIRHLDQQLPCASGTEASSPGVPAKDVENYSKLYRYFPVFAESEV